MIEAINVHDITWIHCSEIGLAKDQVEMQCLFHWLSAIELDDTLEPKNFT
jgi:hypothetical protein